MTELNAVKGERSAYCLIGEKYGVSTKYGLIILVPLVSFGFNARKPAAQGQRALEFVPLSCGACKVFTQPYFGGYAVGQLIRLL